MHDEATKLYELHGIPVRLRFDGDRYFVQEACADLTTDQDRLAPYLQDQLSFLLIRQGLASG